MKKESWSSIFLSVIAVIILICAALLLTLATLSFISAPKNQDVYDFIKDHGSLIAGLIGFGGVLVLVVVQMRTTKNIINSSRENVVLASREAESSAFYKNIRLINIKLSEIANKNIGNLSLSNSDFNYLDEKLDDVLIFLKKNKLKRAYFQFLKDFLSLYQQKIYGSYDGELAPDLIDSTFKVLYDANIYQLDKCLIEYSDINNSSLPQAAVDFFEEIKKTSFDDIDEDFFRSVIFLLSTYSSCFIDNSISLD